MQHQDILCAALFLRPNSENYVVTGCFDKTIRVWNVPSRKVIDWQQTPNFITAMQTNEAGDKLVVGLADGVLLVYDCASQNKSSFDQRGLGSKQIRDEGLRLFRRIDVKNQHGNYSDGRKVTGVDFLTGAIAMITTNDSRIRFVNIITGVILIKLKGHMNDHYFVRASHTSDERGSYAICGSEDGNVYLWN